MQDLYKAEKYDYSAFLKKFAMENKDTNSTIEFVIALDTSSSVEGELLDDFVVETYEFLKSTEIFNSKINIHIIQCDCKIHLDTKITSQKEFEDYIRDMNFYGNKSSDFTPVFNRVNEMIASKEFSNLKGLFYFTDGYVPTEKPDYDVAFVFPWQIKEIPPIPQWAKILVLNKWALH